MLPGSIRCACATGLMPTQIIQAVRKPARNAGQDPWRSALLWPERAHAPHSERNKRQYLASMRSLNHALTKGRKVIRVRTGVGRTTTYLYQARSYALGQRFGSWRISQGLA